MLQTDTDTFIVKPIKKNLVDLMADKFLANKVGSRL